MKKEQKEQIKKELEMVNIFIKDHYEIISKAEEKAKKENDRNKSEQEEAIQELKSLINEERTKEIKNQEEIIKLINEKNEVYNKYNLKSKIIDLCIQYYKNKKIELLEYVSFYIYDLIPEYCLNKRDLKDFFSLIEYWSIYTSTERKENNKNLCFYGVNCLSGFKFTLFFKSKDLYNYNIKYNKYCAYYTSEWTNGKWEEFFKPEKYTAEEKEKTIQEIEKLYNNIINFKYL